MKYMYDITELKSDEERDAWKGQVYWFDGLSYGVPYDISWDSVWKRIQNYGHGSQNSDTICVRKYINSNGDVCYWNCHKTEGRWEPVKCMFGKPNVYTKYWYSKRCYGGARIVNYRFVD